MSNTSNPATADTPQVLLEHHLKQLRLPSFLREYDKLSRQCAAEQADYPHYLLRLSELELLDRERRATERRIHQARFTLLQAVAFAVHLQDVNMVGEAVQQGSGQPLRAQHLGPFLERQVAGDHCGASFVALAEDL